MRYGAFILVFLVGVAVNWVIGVLVTNDNPLKSAPEAFWQNNVMAALFAATVVMLW